MKNRYWLFRRNGVFYVQDAQTRHRESLHTSDRTEAERIRDARNQVAERPNLGIAMAKAYLTAHDPKIAVRTWQDVLDEFSRRGKPQTREHRRTVSARKPFDLIRNQRILETTATDFLAVMQKGGVMSGRGWVTTTPSTVPPRAKPGPQGTTTVVVMGPTTVYHLNRIVPLAAVAISGLICFFLPGRGEHNR